MARYRPDRMLPPSQTPPPAGSEDPGYETNAVIVAELIETHGEFIHWWGTDEGYASAYSADLAEGLPLAVVLPSGPTVGSTAALASSLKPWARTKDCDCQGVFRLEFEREVAAHRPDLLESVRTQLEGAYSRQDGSVVVVLLPEHIIVTTCIDRTQAN